MSWNSEIVAGTAARRWIPRMHALTPDAWRRYDKMVDTTSESAHAIVAKWGGTVPVMLGAVTIAAFIVLAGVAVARVDELSSEVAIGLVAAVVPGVIGVIVAVIGHLDHRQAAAEREALRSQADEERDRLRYEQIVLSSLDYFTGQDPKAKRRHCGPVLQGAWSKMPHLRSIFVPLLVNQAMYLLEESEQEEARHERENLDRIIGARHRFSPTCRSVGRHIPASAGLNHPTDERHSRWQGCRCGQGHFGGMAAGLIAGVKC